MKYMNCFYLYENAVSKGVLTMVRQFGAVDLVR